MRSYLLLCIALLSTVTMNTVAQTTRTVTVNGKTIGDDGVTIDKVQYRITYKSQSVNDTTNVDSLGNYNYLQDEMRLDIGDNVSYFYSYINYRRDSVISERVKQGDFDFSNVGGGGSISWTLYRNYPEGKVVVFDNCKGNSYRMTEAVSVPEWSIVPDSSKQILGYECQLAQAAFKGRKWYAWYTDDIPLDNGPWKLSGLPGLILQAHDASMQFIFNVVGLEQVNGKSPILYDTNKDKCEEVTMKQFGEIKKKMTLGDMFAGSDMKNITASDEHGNKIDEKTLKVLLNRHDPYNAIER